LCEAHARQDISPRLFGQPKQNAYECRSLGEET
jgi:hypothetical protein